MLRVEGNYVCFITCKKGGLIKSDNLSQKYKYFNKDWQIKNIIARIYYEKISRFVLLSFYGNAHLSTVYEVIFITLETNVFWSIIN